MLASIPARTLNPIRSRRGIPRFSLFGKCSNEEPAARREQLFGDQDRKRGPDRATDNAVIASFVIKSIEIGVVAGPTDMAVGASRSTQVPHDVAIWIENADFWDSDGGQTFLASRFAQQALGREGR
jgi:hypothetical protein